jgi:hypothetical protein
LKTQHLEIEFNIGGGASNTASAKSSFVGGGNINTASGDRSTVSGGYKIQHQGDRSVKQVVDAAIQHQ